MWSLPHLAPGAGVDGTQEDAARRLGSSPLQLIADVGPPQQRALLRLLGRQRSLKQRLQHTFDEHIMHMEINFHTRAVITKPFQPESYLAIVVSGHRTSAGKNDRDSDRDREEGHLHAVGAAGQGSLTAQGQEPQLRGGGSLQHGAQVAAQARHSVRPHLHHRQQPQQAAVARIHLHIILSSQVFLSLIPSLHP